MRVAILLSVVSGLAFGLSGCDDDALGPAADTAIDTLQQLDTGGGGIFDPDTGAGDSATPDTTAPDTSVPDTTVEDTSVQDTNVQDTTVQDSADTNVQDTTVADSDAQETADTADVSDVGPDATPVDNGLNASWVGGACASASDCDHPAFSLPARCETSDFPNGFCTQECKQSTTSGAWICPDADTAAGTVFTTTRCISADGAPRCAAECDFTKSDNGCRPGYACVLRSRHGQPDKVFPVCLPEPGQRWPGEPEPIDDIGQPCSLASDCAHRSCLGLPGGYCSKAYCDESGCPGASTCFGFSGGDAACLQDCGVDGECRTGEGYLCDIDGTCWPGDTSPTWDPDLGAGDCASAWGSGGSGLSSCDTQKDDYVVLHKSARNIALCKSGNLVANYRMGLGFAPTGDKQVEGDGKTPEGVFYVAMLVPDSDYYKAFLVSYPDKSDATRGVTGGIITQAQKNAIDTAQTQCTAPPQSTGLGGWIEIHGMGGESDWTLGCAALDNEAIDVLWSVLAVRDTIVILP